MSSYRLFNMPLLVLKFFQLTLRMLLLVLKLLKEVLLLAVKLLKEVLLLEVFLMLLMLVLAFLMLDLLHRDLLPLFLLLQKSSRMTQMQEERPACLWVLVRLAPMEPESSQRLALMEPQA